MNKLSATVKPEQPGTMTRREVADYFFNGVDPWPESEQRPRFPQRLLNALIWLTAALIVFLFPARPHEH